MDTDLLFVTGLIFVGLALVFLMSAFAERRRPFRGVLVLLMGLALAGTAIYQRPTLYSVQTAPDAFVRVVASYIF